MFCAEIRKKISEFLSGSFQFLEVKFSIYLNRRVFVMWIFFFFSSPALFVSPRGDRIYCLCTLRSRKGMPQAVKSIRLRNRACKLCKRDIVWKDWTISINFFAWMVG